MSTDIKQAVKILRSRGFQIVDRARCELLGRCKGGYCAERNGIESCELLETTTTPASSAIVELVPDDEGSSIIIWLLGGFLAGVLVGIVVMKVYERLRTSYPRLNAATRGIADKPTVTPCIILMPEDPITDAEHAWADVMDDPRVLAANDDRILPVPHVADDFMKWPTWDDEFDAFHNAAGDAPISDRSDDEADGRESDSNSRDVDNEADGREGDSNSRDVDNEADGRESDSNSRDADNEADGRESVLNPRDEDDEDAAIG